MAAEGEGYAGVPFPADDAIAVANGGAGDESSAPIWLGLSVDAASGHSSSVASWPLLIGLRPDFYPSEIYARSWRGICNQLK